MKLLSVGMEGLEPGLYSLLSQPSLYCGRGSNVSKAPNSPVGSSFPNCQTYPYNYFLSLTSKTNKTFFLEFLWSGEFLCLTSHILNCCLHRARTCNLRNQKPASCQWPGDNLFLFIFPSVCCLDRVRTCNSAAKRPRDAISLQDNKERPFTSQVFMCGPGGIWTHIVSYVTVLQTACFSQFAYRPIGASEKLQLT